ncbi:MULTISPECIES: ABC transporter substrate-binding protein [Rhizobium/Agrobacterium group]|uniref:ABC transporter substrate-binding protein n=1 Tax=Rhizobium/Agrobacterium group TaxID=227290 RepID=UPI0008FB1B99|nr:MULTISPECIES: ABC transporter substrate-binding protein [Rhizobium/Agrobacterium group]MCF1436504.1 peptide ABC transporter substrate-binding protein [Allorhizobium ampelinum]MCF1464477.1 peptide ABC transporter substrate-binding protein [Allorhizobium ampelinum]MCF1495845.1 peptide ABC transporter substrate-binding protein [Allorhizobium ampelinum]MUO91211.1 peptide ABC transporter substrate-binding protein [Agrobacterium vitis]MUZ54284.1 peptide ABC transporter substrate-binding protein [
MKTTRRTLLKAGLAGAAIQFMSVPGRAQAPNGTLRFGLSAFPPNLQPWVGTGTSAGTVKSLIHRSLVAFDSKGNLRGELATAWSIDAEGAWVFSLRQDAVFHNGEPVTAEDVKWSIEQIAAEKSTAYMRAQFQRVAKIEIVDPQTIRLITTEPQATLPLWFANYDVFIIWRKSTENEPIGAGPFRLVGQERGTSLDLEAFDKFYKPGLPKLKSIKFVVYADENLRQAALMSGDIDIIEYVPWQSMAAVEKSASTKLDAVEGPFMYIVFNATKAPFNDVRVRRAVAHAVNRDDIVKAVFFGRGKKLEGIPIVEGTPWYDADLAHGWKYDPTRAKALLAEAGFPDGFQTTLLATAQYGMHKDTAEVVQQHLAAIGINCELRLPDWPTRVSLGRSGQYDIAIHGNAADNNDPDGLTAVLDTSRPPTHGLSFGLKAPRTIAGLAAGRAEFDQDKRVAIYREMQRAAIEEVPMVGLAWRSQGYGMLKSVKDFSNLPGALTIFSGATLEETYFA